jgi:hypothetical protein
MSYAIPLRSPSQTRVNLRQAIRLGQILRRVDIEERVYRFRRPIDYRAGIAPGEYVDPANTLLRHGTTQFLPKRYVPQRHHRVGLSPGRRTRESRAFTAPRRV